MTSSVRFTEEMLGHVTFGEPDFARGAQPDRDGVGGVQVPPHDRGRRTSRPSATTRCAPRRAIGWVECDALGGKLPVEQGWFNLFVDVEPGVKHMLYRLWFRDGVGHPLTMTGFKVVKNDAGFDVWKDTTTLFTRVLRGHVRRGRRRRRATVRRLRDHHHPRARLRQAADDVPLRRGRALGAQLGALAKFGVIFVAAAGRGVPAQGEARRVSTRKAKRLAAAEAARSEAHRPHARARRARRRRGADRLRRRADARVAARHAARAAARSPPRRSAARSRSRP